MRHMTQSSEMNHKPRESLKIHALMEMLHEIILVQILKVECNCVFYRGMAHVEIGQSENLTAKIQPSLKLRRRFSGRSFF